MQKMKKALLFLIVLILLFSTAIAEGAGICYQRSSITKLSGDVLWVDESPFAGTDENDLLQVDFVGIRQGDCIIISYKGYRMLVDGGEGFRIATVERYLASKGITHFDSFLLTHAHDDHIGIQEKLLYRTYGPDVQYSPYGDDEKYEAWTPYVNKLINAGIERVRLQTGDEITIQDDVTMQIYRWPRLSAGLMNSHSIVSMLSFGNARMLLTGDISGDTQTWLLENFDPALFKCDILKAPHHGNVQMATAFLDAVSPSLTVITNPKSATEAINRQLDKRGIARFDIFYTVHCQTDGNIWYVWLEKMPE